MILKYLISVLSWSLAKHPTLWCVNQCLFWCADVNEIGLCWQSTGNNVCSIQRYIIMASLFFILKRDPLIGPLLIGPPTHWSPNTLLELIGTPSHWSPISVVPLFIRHPIIGQSQWPPISLVPHLISTPTHQSPISLVPQLAPIYHPFHWSPIPLVPPL